MPHHRLPPCLWLAAWLSVAVLAGCEDSQPTVQSPSPDNPVGVPDGPEIPVIAAPLMEPVPAAPAVEESPETVATPETTAGEAAAVVEAPREAVEPELSKPLVLTIDTGPGPEHTGNRFGKAPDPAWLGNRRTAGGLADDSGSGKLLPDLFDRKQAREPVSVRSELLIDESSADLSRTVDGAGVVIEYNTD